MDLQIRLIIVTNNRISNYSLIKKSACVFNIDLKVYHFNCYKFVHKRLHINSIVMELLTYIFQALKDNETVLKEV